MSVIIRLTQDIVVIEIIFHEDHCPNHHIVSNQSYEDKLKSSIYSGNKVSYGYISSMRNENAAIGEIGSVGHHSCGVFCQLIWDHVDDTLPEKTVPVDHSRDHVVVLFPVRGGEVRDELIEGKINWLHILYHCVFCSWLHVRVCVDELWV